MSNIKSWADASSDEESDDDDRIAPPPSGLPGSSSYGQLNAMDEEESEHEEEGDHYDDAPQGFEHLIPSEPPYTAFVGNLHYDMRTSNDLGREVEDMLRARRCVARDGGGQVLGDVRLASARLITDRNTGQSRGIGYVEFDSPEEVSCGRATTSLMFSATLWVVAECAAYTAYAVQTRIQVVRDVVFSLIPCPNL